MIRWAFFVILAACLIAYSLWIYLRVDLAVPIARWLALVRAAVLVTVLTLLFDPRLPMEGIGGVSTQWALLDASISMGALGADSASPWVAASARARELEANGWTVVTFGGDAPASTHQTDAAPTELASLLAPALHRAAEAGARHVVVLSDLRFEDAVAVRSALQTLPLDVDFERFGGAVSNAGVARLDVPDFSGPDESITAEVEVYGGRVGDSLRVEIFEEDESVATLRIAAPLPGLRRRASVILSRPNATGRVRYSAVVSVEDDAFPADDRAVDYAAVGHQEGALVLVSLVPDWEPRYLLPVLQEVTGLPAVGYLRAGPNRFVQAGRAIDRGRPVDSTVVRRAVTDAALVVVHGLGGDLDPWARALVIRPGRKVLMARDASGASLAGVTVVAARGGEWYASADIPPSPIAGSLSGVELQGLPPLTDVLVTAETAALAPLLLQLRGAGSPEAALYLGDRPSGRVAIALASGFWRWASRERGREPYRRLWSGVVGWLLADQVVSAAEPRPVQWVVARGEPVVWSIPADSAESHIIVRSRESTVVDTVVAGGGTLATGVLEPGAYTYLVESSTGDTLGAGRFDVAEATEEMLPVAESPPQPVRRAAVVGVDGGGGRPFRTLPWPYLLIITLLCVEWISRRRSGLR